ncbi:MAG: Ig-like domain repeat protein, partial [Terriglobales bacterium]
TATYTITSGAGTCTVKANQAGNSDYSSAPQATESVSATPASQTINVTTPAPATAVKSSSFTVVASATSGLPITWGSAGICTNVHGTYTMTASSGTCTVTMNAPSSVNYTAATQVTETTNGALPIAPTVSLTGPATAPYQSTYTVVATTNASTTPTFTALPATVCTVSGPTVTMVNGTGMCTVTAHWAADDVYKAATATAKTTATKVASVVTWNTPAAITYGTALSATQLDATASVPGAFVYDPASGKVLGAGTQTLSVKFTPTATSDYTTVAATTVSLVVNQANTTTAITSTSLNPSIVGHSITVHYNVASPGKATGSVTITASSGETCTGTVSSVTGDGSCIIKPETVGSITLTGTYGGDANNNGSTSAGFTQTVNN